MTEREQSVVLAILMFLVSAGLLAAAAMCEILGIGNLLNGGHYISKDPALVIALIGLGPLAASAFFVRGAIRKLRR
jgi:hypothetical protein